MAAKKKASKAADPATELGARIEARKAILKKLKDKAPNDPKRRLQAKKLRRAQRALGKVKAHAKRVEAAAAKKAKKA